MRYAQHRIDIGRRKKLPTTEDLNPNTKFIDNLLIHQIETSGKLTTYLEKRSLGWHKYPELIKNLYNSLVASDYYKEYMKNPERSYKEDAKLVEDFYMNEVDDHQQVEEVIEEQSILWADDMDFALILAIRTITSSRKGQPDLPILPQYKNDDDREFAGELLRRTLVNYNEYQKYIEKLTQNWDLERIAFMDNLIMAAAIAELVSFDSIPVKVTLDEYIEISKYYSTQNSSHFINGIIDKVIDILTEEGRIHKSGRGLL
jgi:N utilization substance protein B